MAQVHYKDEEFRGTLYFMVYQEFEDTEGTTEISFTNYEQMNNNLKMHYEGKHAELFRLEDIIEVEFKGIGFSGRQGSEKFSVNIEDGWKRATIMFDESKFGDININKMDRIKKIIEEWEVLL